jgi:hypothetical protein
VRFHSCLCVPPIAARQWGLLFDERRDRPFSVGALTEQDSGPPPPSHTETILSLLNIYLIIGADRRENTKSVCLVNF